MGSTIYENQIIDHGTGELLKSSKMVRKKVEYYYTQYSNGENCLSEIMGLTAKELKLIMLMSSYAFGDSNEVNTVKSVTESILNYMAIKIESYYKLKVSLKKKGMIIEHRGLKLINPEYFWRGSVLDREKILNEIREERLNK